MLGGQLEIMLVDSQHDQKHQILPIMYLLFGRVMGQSMHDLILLLLLQTYFLRVDIINIEGWGV